MNDDEFENLTKSIKDKLGDEATALIADDLGLLLSDHMQINENLSSKDTQIQNLQKEKENLIKTNGNLLQQVAVQFSNNSNIEETNDKPKQEFSFKNCFDEKGKFLN